MANFVPKIEYGSPATTITFELPPADDFQGQAFRANTRTNVSTGGVEQSQFNYVREERKIKLTFVSEALKTAFDTFFQDHGGRGLEFKYFESEDEVDFITVTLAAKNYAPKILFPANTGYVYDIEFTIIRTL